MLDPGAISLAGPARLPRSTVVGRFVRFRQTSKLSHASTACRDMQNIDDGTNLATLPIHAREYRSEGGD